MCAFASVSGDNSNDIRPSADPMAKQTITCMQHDSRQRGRIVRQAIACGAFSKIRGKSRTGPCEAGQSRRRSRRTWSRTSRRRDMQSRAQANRWPISPSMHRKQLPGLYGRECRYQRGRDYWPMLVPADTVIGSRSPCQQLVCNRTLADDVYWACSPRTFASRKCSKLECFSLTDIWPAI